MKKKGEDLGKYICSRPMFGEMAKYFKVVLSTPNSLIKIEEYCSDH